MDAPGKPSRDVTLHVPYIQIGNDESDADPDGWDKGKEAYVLLEDRKVESNRKIFVLEDGGWLVDQWSLSGTRLNGKWVRVAMRLRDKCPHCGHTLAVNGFRLGMTCPECSLGFSFNHKYWPMVLEDPDNDYDQGEGGCTINFETEVSWKAAPPACGHGNVTYPPPAWLAEIMPSIRQFYCGERPDAEGNILAAGAGGGAGARGGTGAGEAAGVGKAIAPAMVHPVPGAERQPEGDDPGGHRGLQGDRAGAARQAAAQHDEPALGQGVDPGAGRGDRCAGMSEICLTLR